MCDARIIWQRPRRISVQSVSVWRQRVPDTAPTFQTSSEKYAWLNGVQAVGKMVEVKVGAGGYVKYDVFIVR